MVKSRTHKKQDPNKPDDNMIRNAIYVTEAFHFPTDMSLKFINSGMLGYQTKEDGTTKEKEGKKIPIVVGRTKYFEYKKKYTDLPEMYKYLQSFALNGYTKLVTGFQEELAVLHKLSIENMLSTKDPLARQTIIDSLIKNVIPTESAFADMLKELVENMPKEQKMEEETTDNNSHD